MSDTAAAPAAPAAPAKPKSPWGPVLAVIVLAPALSFALAELVLIPKLREAVQTESAHAATATVGTEPAAAHGEPKEAKPAASHGAAKSSHGKSSGHGGAGAASNSHEFEGIVVNLAGSMGTRYLKATFTVYGSDDHLADIMKENRTRLLDAALGVLSSRSLADLESPGAKNMVRTDLITRFNQVLNSTVVSELYFTEFVVQ